MRVRSGVHAGLQAVGDRPLSNPTSAAFFSAEITTCLMAANELHYCSTRIAVNGADSDSLFHNPQRQDEDLLHRLIVATGEFVEARSVRGERYLTIEGNLDERVSEVGRC